MSEKFGTLEEVDIREIWPTEDGHFTPWLRDNLDQLGAVLGLDLEAEETEAAVGRFALDLLARDVARGTSVAIENQYGTSDHDHFGKLLTYAAGYDAGVAIWVAQVFTDEHRSALEWMNRRSSSDLNLYGVVVRVVRIDDSRPVPVFDTVVAPIDFGRRQPQLSGRRPAYQAFFQQLIDQLREEHRFTTARKGQPNNWYSFGSGVSGFLYTASFTRGHNARVELYVDAGSQEQNKSILASLRAAESEIAEALGATPEWDDIADARACRVYVERPGTIDVSAADLDAIRAWMIGFLLKFRAAFGTRLREAIDAADQFETATEPVVVGDDDGPPAATPARA